jgi:predicted transcriptional regulator
MLPRLAQQDGNYVFEILEQRNVLTLLESIKESPKSVQQLALKCKIPLSTAYRTIGEMARLDFVKIKYVFNESGKWEKIYRYNEFFIEHIKNKNVANPQTNFEGSLK